MPDCMIETQQYIANTEKFRIPEDWKTTVEALDPERKLGNSTLNRLFFTAWRTIVDPEHIGYLDVAERLDPAIDDQTDEGLAKEVAEISNTKDMGASVWQEEQDRRRAAALRRQAQETIFSAEPQSATHPVPTDENRQGFINWLVDKKRFSAEMFETPVKAIPTTRTQQPTVTGTSINDTIERTRAGEREAVAKEREEFLNRLAKIGEQLK